MMHDAAEKHFQDDRIDAIKIVRDWKSPCPRIPIQRQRAIVTRQFGRLIVSGGYNSRAPEISGWQAELNAIEGRSDITIFQLLTLPTSQT
jgi:hypothetical protein